MATKRQLIHQIAAHAGTSKVEAARMLDAVASAIHHTAHDGAIRIDNLGIFEVVNLPNRQARNPQTGEAITVPAGKKLRLRSKRF